MSKLRGIANKIGSGVKSAANVPVSAAKNELSMISSSLNPKNMLASVLSESGLGGYTSLLKDILPSLSNKPSSVLNKTGITSPAQDKDSSSMSDSSNQVVSLLTSILAVSKENMENTKKILSSSVKIEDSLEDKGTDSFDKLEAEREARIQAEKNSHPPQVQNITQGSKGSLIDSIIGFFGGLGVSKIFMGGLASAMVLKHFNISGIVRSLAQGITGGFKMVGRGALKIITSIFSLHGIIRSLSSAITSGFGFVVSSASSIVRNVFSLRPIIEGIGKGITSGFEAIARGASGLVRGIFSLSPVVRTISQFLIGGFKSIGRGAGVIVRSIFSLVPVVSTIAASLTKGIASVFSLRAVIGALGKLALITTIIGALGSGIIAGFNEWQESGDLGKTITAGIDGALKFLTFDLVGVEDIQNAINGFSTFFQENVNPTIIAFFDTVKSLVESVTGFLNERIADILRGGAGVISIFPGAGGVAKSLADKANEIDPRTRELFKGLNREGSGLEGAYPGYTPKKSDIQKSIEDEFDYSKLPKAVFRKGISERAKLFNEAKREWDRRISAIQSRNYSPQDKARAIGRQYEYFRRLYGFTNAELSALDHSREMEGARSIDAFNAQELQRLRAVERQFSNSSKISDPKNNGIRNQTVIVNDNKSSTVNNVGSGKNSGTGNIPISTTTNHSSKWESEGLLR